MSTEYPHYDQTPHSPISTTPWKRDAVLTVAFIVLTAVVAMLPTGYEHKVYDKAERVKAKVLSTDNSGVQQFGIVKAGDQVMEVEILSGARKGQVVEGINHLMGKMDMDKMFQPGDEAYAILSLTEEGEVHFANIQDHYRLDTQALLFGLFALILVAFAGFTGAKALLSFLFTGVVIWKLMVPAMLNGHNPILVSLAVVTTLTAAIIFLVGGLNRRGAVAFLGASLGVVTTCVLALVFSNGFHLHGAVKPYAETLLYAGYEGLSLTDIFLASIFLASSGAVMDLAMDVAAAQYEVFAGNPGIGRKRLLLAGFNVGRAVVGTMTTTLLLAYTGGYISLLMLFMAQGVPPTHILNINYVSAEVLNTLVGSFGLVLVAPFTAIMGALLYKPAAK